MWPALSERCRRNYLSHWLGKPILTLRKIIYSIYSHLLRILSIPIPYPIFFMFFLSWNPSKSFQIRCQDAANNIEPTTGIDIALPASKLHKFGLQFLSFRRAKSKPCLPATTLISETPNHLKNQTHFTTHTHTHTNHRKPLCQFLGHFQIPLQIPEFQRYCPARCKPKSSSPLTSSPVLKL